MSLPPLRRCWDLTEGHIVEAIGDRKAMGKLLKDLAALAQPNSGAPKILIAIARLAKPPCPWIDGPLRVEISGNEATQIRIMEDLGGGVRELVFPRLTLAVPVAEMDRSIRLAPRAMAPLEPTKEGDVIVLTHKRARSSLEPPTFELAEDCIRRSLPPDVRKSISPSATPKKSASLSGPPSLKAAPVLKARPKTKAKSSPPDPTGFGDMPRLPKILDFGELLGAKDPPRSSKRPPSKG